MAGLTRLDSERGSLLQVRHADTNVLLANLTSENDAVFQVRGIPESTECIALVFAFNEKGRSEPIRVMIQAISPPSKLLTNSECLCSRRARNRRSKADRSGPDRSVAWPGVARRCPAWRAVAWRSGEIHRVILLVHSTNDCQRR